MKKITILVPDETNIGDLSDLMAVAIEFKMETVPNSAPTKRSWTPHAKHHQPGKTIVGMIQEHYTPSGHFTKQLVEKWITAHGYAKTSASPAISELRANGYVEEISPQTYKWLKGPEKAAE